MKHKLKNNLVPNHPQKQLSNKFQKKIQQTKLQLFLLHLLQRLKRPLVQHQAVQDLIDPPISES